MVFVGPSIKILKDSPKLKFQSENIRIVPQGW